MITDSNQKNNLGTFFRVAAPVLLFAAILLPSLVPTASAAPKQTVQSEFGGWHIRCDKAEVYMHKSSAEFTGHVVITRHATEIRADYVNIITKETHSSGKQPMTMDDFNKVIATGNVRIKLKKGSATSQKAVYDAGTKLVVLSGGATFTNPKINVKGPVIEWNRETGKVAVKASAQQPVTGDIFPGKGP